MMAKPMKTLELHYPMIQFLINTHILQKNGACLDFSQLIVLRPSSISTCGSKAKCKPAFDWNVTVSFQLFLTQENDFDIDSDFEDFDSDEESDSKLVWYM